MKKILLVLLSLITIFMLPGCGLLDSVKNKVPQTTTSNEPAREGSFDFDNCSTFKDVYGLISNNGKAFMPSTGKVKVLIIPIWFDGVSGVVSAAATADIQKTFFGTEQETGWESLKSYFYESSYGKLEYEGDITNWYHPIQSKSYYEQAYNENKSGTALGNLLIEALNYYDSQYNYKDYDSDGDGLIDAVYMLYNTPFSNSDTLWWAWQGYNNENTTFDGVDVYQYMWGGIDFMYHDNSGKRIYNKLNASTFIHETTHLMGADDYYDYDPNTYERVFLYNKKTPGKGCNLGVGDYDMMDTNVGDHNPVTKMFLGWIDPYVIASGETTIDLTPFSSTGKTVVICPGWRDSTNIMSEFLVVDFYDNAGLDANNDFTGEQFGTTGVRIYHVNAVVEKDDDYWSIFKYDNSYTDWAFITLIDAEGNLDKTCDFLDSDVSATSKSLFQTGQEYIPNNHMEYVNKELLNVSIKVNTLTATGANITVGIK